jgi:hypothetical protein
LIFQVILQPPLIGALTATVDDDGEARGHGAVHIQDSLSKTILVADGAAQASCADADGDGVGGLVRLTVGLRDIRTGASYTAVISPLEGDVDESGRFKVRISFERGEPSEHVFAGWLQVRFFDQHR